MNAKRSMLCSSDNSELPNENIASVPYSGDASDQYRCAADGRQHHTASYTQTSNPRDESASEVEAEDADDLYENEYEERESEGSSLVESGEQDRQTSHSVSGMGSGDILDSADSPPDEEFDRMGLWELVDAGGLGDVWQDASVDLVGDEDDRNRPHYTDAELDFAAQSYLPNPRKTRRRRRIGVYLPTFSEDDFEEGPQREAFIMLRDYVRACYLANPSDRERDFALRWVFEGDNSIPFSFDLCCRVLSADPQILRTRLQYEFYLRWKVAMKPFSEACAPLPEHLYSHAWYVAGSNGALVVALIWSWPGVDMGSLYPRLTDQKKMSMATFNGLMERLDEHGVIQGQGENWYATGRGGREGFY